MLRCNNPQCSIDRMPLIISKICEMNGITNSEFMKVNKDEAWRWQEPLYICRCANKVRHSWQQHNFKGSNCSLGCYATMLSHRVMYGTHYQQACWLALYDEDINGSHVVRAAVELGRAGGLEAKLTLNMFNPVFLKWEYSLNRQHHQLFQKTIKQHSW